MLCVVSSLGISLLVKGGRILSILIPQYVSTFLRRVIIITQNSKIIIPLHTSIIIQEMKTTEETKT